MELTQRRPSGYSTSRPEKLGSKKMGSNTFHSVVARARKSTLERVSMLTSVDDADMDNELLFESFDHRINSVERMLSRSRANRETEWKKIIGAFLVTGCMYMYYFVALPWFLLIYLNFSTYKLSWDYSKNEDQTMVWKRRTRPEESKEVYDELFDGLNKEELKHFQTFETIEKPVFGTEIDIQDEYREFIRRRDMLKKVQTVKDKPLHFTMGNRFLDYGDWESNRPHFVVSELFEDDSYTKFAKDKLSSRRKSYLYDLAALDNAFPKCVEMIHARASASRKLYHFARKIYRKELENENLKEFTSFGDSIKSHWKEVMLTFGALLDAVGIAALIVFGDNSYGGRGTAMLAQTIPILVGFIAAALFVFVLYIYTLRGREVREWLDSKLIETLGIEADVILGSTIHFYFIMSLLPMFIVYFVFNWFAAPRFGLDCQHESKDWTMCRTHKCTGGWPAGNIPTCGYYNSSFTTTPTGIYGPKGPLMPTPCKITPGIFTCASDEFTNPVTDEVTVANPICCKVNNNQFAPFILIAFLFANAKAGMSAIAIIADFFLEVKKGKKELGGGSIFVVGRSEKLPNLLNARKTSRAKRAVNSRRGSQLLNMKEITDDVLHQGIWCSGPNCISHGDENRDIITSGIVWHHKNRLVHFCDECYEEENNKELFRIANESPFIWGTKKQKGANKTYNEKNFHKDYYQATTPGESYEFMWNNLIVAFGKPRNKLGVPPSDFNPHALNTPGITRFYDSEKDRSTQFDAYEAMKKKRYASNKELSISVADFYEECYRLADIEQTSYCKKSPLSFARYIDAQRVVTEYIENLYEVEESNVNSFDHSTFSDNCIENEEQLKWFLMAFVEVGFEYKTAEREIEKCKSKDKPEVYDPICERPNKATCSSSWDLMGGNTEMGRFGLDVYTNPKYTGYLNQFVDEDNSFDEGLNPVRRSMDAVLQRSGSSVREKAVEFSFNHLQDNKDETKLKSYNLDSLTSMMGRMKEQKKARRWGKLRSVAKNGGKKSRRGSDVVQLRQEEKDSLVIDVANPTFVADKEEKQDKEVKEVKDEEVQVNENKGDKEEKEEKDTKKEKTKNQSKRARRLSKVIKRNSIKRRGSAETMIGLVNNGNNNVSTATPAATTSAAATTTAATKKKNHSTAPPPAAKKKTTSPPAPPEAFHKEK